MKSSDNKGYRGFRVNVAVRKIMAELETVVQKEAVQWGDKDLNVVNDVLAKVGFEVQDVELSNAVDRFDDVVRKLMLG